MEQILICDGCGRPMSSVLTLFDETYSAVEYKFIKHSRVPLKGTVGPNDIVPDLNYGVDAIPKGIAFKAVMSIGCFNPVEPLHPDEQYWLNLDDILPHIGNNHFWNKGYGCCGTSILPSNKPNRRCVCDTDVGFESRDCFQVHLFIPDPENTRWEPA